MAGQWSIRDLISHSEVFATSLRTTTDSNEAGRRRGEQFAAEVETCIESWRSLSRLLQDPYLQRGRNFTECLARIIDDYVEIISCLRRDLAASTSIQSRAQRRIRINIGHDSNRPLVRFIGKSTTLLRQKQIRYTNVALRLIQAVACHARALGYRHSTALKLQEVREEQQATIAAHFTGCLNAIDEEISGNSIYSHQWLSDRNCNFYNPGGGLPLESVAILWFRPGMTTENGLHEGGLVNTHPHDDEVARTSELRLQHDLQELQTEMQEFRSHWEAERNEHQEQMRAERNEHQQQIRTERNNYDQQRTADRNNFNQQLTTERNNFYQQLRALQASVQQLNTQVSNLGLQNTSKQKEIDKLKLQNNEIVSDLREHKEKVQKLEKLIRQQKITIDKLQKEKGGYELKIENLKKENEDLKAGNQDLVQRYEELIDVVAKLQDLADSRKFEDEERSKLEAKIAGLERKCVKFEDNLATRVQEHEQKINVLTKERDAAQTQAQNLERQLAASQACNKSLREKSAREGLPPTSYPKHHKKRRQSPVRSERKIRPQSISEGYVSQDPDSGYSTETFIEAHTQDRDVDKASIRSNSTRNISLSSSPRVRSVESSPQTISSTFQHYHNSGIDDYEERTHNVSYRSRRTSANSRLHSNDSGERSQNRNSFRRMFGVV